MVPESDSSTLDLGRQYTIGEECYPEIVTLGGFLKILEDMKTRYLLSYQVEGALQEGWHELEVDVTGDRADEVRARTGYTVTAARN